MGFRLMIIGPAFYQLNHAYKKRRDSNPHLGTGLLVVAVYLAPVAEGTMEQ